MRVLGHARSLRDADGLFEPVDRETPFAQSATEAMLCLLRGERPPHRVNPAAPAVR